jgi:hypothetical protein
MKKMLEFFLLLMILINPKLFADETKDVWQTIFPKTRSLFAVQNSEISLFKDFFKNKYSPGYNPDLSLDYSERLENESLSLRVEFKLTKEPSGISFFSGTPRTVEIEKKDYLRAGLEAFGTNVAVWFYDKCILRVGYANISVHSVINNIEKGFSWDNNGFQCNQFEHPFHGAMYFSAARLNGFNFWESTIFPLLGSTVWELFFENEDPSTNDVIMTTLGGISLGEALLKTAEIISDENSTGFEKVIHDIASFVLNPVLNIDRLTKRGEWRGFESEHSYNFAMPLGCSFSLNAKPSLTIATELEYEDALKNSSSKIRPYDYFTLVFRLGLYQRDGFRDKEFSVKGILTGKRFDFLPSSKSIGGLFGQFDYVDTAVGGMISSVGAGYGLVANFDFDSGYFLRTNGMLALMVGGCSSSLALEYGEGIFRQYGEAFHLEGSKPYYLGPGLSGRIESEFGKKDFGSISFLYREYWIHSIFATDADERISNLGLRIKYDLTAGSQLSLEYERYLRNSTYRGEYVLSKAKSALKAYYIFRF